MRLIDINSLSVGEKLAMPVRTTSGNTILNAGVTIAQNYISKLKSLGIRKVYIEDERFNDIDLAGSLDEKVWNKAFIVLKETYASVHKGINFDEFAVKDISISIVNHVIEQKDKGVSMLSLNAKDDYIMQHSVNAAILSAFISKKMSYNYNRMVDVVTGALIHDMGRENTAIEENDHIKKGFEAMRVQRGLSLHSSIVCYEHHERYDGRGYPRKIKEKAISEYTRIVSVADRYDNILNDYEGNQPVMPHQAFESILALSGSELDPTIVECFRDAIVFYPNGCSVQLSNGLKAVVIKQNLGSPQRPVVRVYNDSGVIGEINLIRSLTIFIKDVLV